jgi:tetratricopeptide (TPR) repeat protein
VYLPLATRADPAVCWGQADTLGGFIRHITRAEYGSFQLVPADLAASGLAWHTHLVEFARWVWRDTWGAGPALGFLGLLGLVRGVGRTNGVGRAGVILAAVCLLTTGGVFLLLVNAPLDPPLMRGVVARFYILPLGFLSMLAGCGIALLLRLGRTRLGPRGARIARSALALAASAYVCGLVAANHARVDQSDNVVTRNLGLDILRGLPADALLFSRTDLVTNALAYAQHGLGQRRDVVVIDQEMLTYAWHAARMRRRHPAINLPGERYDGRTVFNLDLIDANLPHRPVYFFGFKEESFRAKYRDEPHGLVRQIVPAGAVTDPIALLDANEALVAAMSREGRGSEHPAETFEYEAAGHYAELFFQLGWLAEQAQRYERAAEHYRRAFALRADWRFARNLGVVLADRLGRPAEAADWLERSLQLNPATPDASAVRAKIDYHPREGKGKDE